MDIFFKIDIQVTKSKVETLPMYQPLEKSSTYMVTIIRKITDSCQWDEKLEYFTL